METPNTTWSPLAVESQIAIHLPTAYLRKIVLTAYFASIPRPSHNLEPPEPQKALDLLSLIDTAFIALLKERLEPIAPCIFRPRYLESLWHSGQHISSISSSLNHVQKITGNINLKQGIMSADTRTEYMPYGLQSALWRLAKDKIGRGGLPVSLFNWSQESQDFLLVLERYFNLLSIPETIGSIRRGISYEEKVQSEEFGIVDFEFDGLLAIECSSEFEGIGIHHLGALQQGLLCLGEKAGTPNAVDRDDTAYFIADEKQLLSGEELRFLSSEVSYHVQVPDEMLL